MEMYTALSRNSSAAGCVTKQRIHQKGGSLLLHHDVKEDRTHAWNLSLVPVRVKWNCVKEQSNECELWIPKHPCAAATRGSREYL